MDKWFQEKRIQRMNSSGEIDNVSVWSANTVCVPETTIMEDDLLTRFDNDVLDMFNIRGTVAALSSHDITVKHGKTNSPSKRYKFDYILGTSPEDLMSATDYVDTIVSVCNGDKLMRVIKINTDGTIDINYHTIEVPNEATNYYTNQYKFIIYLFGAFYIGLAAKSQLVAPEIIYTTDFITYTKATHNLTVTKFFTQRDYQILVSYGNFKYEDVRYDCAVVCEKNNNSDGKVLTVFKVHNSSSPDNLTCTEHSLINVCAVGNCGKPTTATSTSMDCYPYIIHRDFTRGMSMTAFNAPTTYRYVCVLTNLISDISAEDNIFCPISNNFNGTSHQGFICLMRMKKDSSLCNIYCIRDVNEGATSSPNVWSTRNLQLKSTNLNFMQFFTRSFHLMDNSSGGWGSHSYQNWDAALYSPSLKEVEYLHYNYYEETYAYKLSTWQVGSGGLCRESAYNNYIDISDTIKSASADDRRYADSYTGTGGGITASTGTATMTISKPTDAPDCTEWDIVYINASNGDHALIFPKAKWGFGMYGNVKARVIFSTANTGLVITASSITIKCKNGAADSDYNNQPLAVMNAKGVSYTWQAET